MTPSGTASASDRFSPPDPLADLGVDLLEVDVRDPLGEAPDESDVVPAAVRDVAGVEAEVDELGVRVGEEPLDPLLGVHVGVGVRVEDEL